jgi:hypothetical protein
MATKQDLLDLEGSEIVLGEIIVTTPQGPIIAARLLVGDDIELTPLGQSLCDQLDGKVQPSAPLPKRRRTAPVVEAPAEAPADAA